MTSPLLAKALTDFADEFGLTRPDVSLLEVRERAFEEEFDRLERDHAGYVARLGADPDTREPSQSSLSRPSGECRGEGARS